MKTLHRVLSRIAPYFAAAGLVWGCAFDMSLREYLDAHFWLPFSKHPFNFERRGVRRISRPFAGMLKVQGDSPLARLRAAYQAGGADPVAQNQALAAARADKSLLPRDLEEVDLIDAKIDIRQGDANQPEPLRSAQKKLEKFLQTARTPEFLSEARGWLAHVDYLSGDHTAAGKIYIDELNRNGSNLSRDTLLTSLQMNYGYDGGPELLAHLDEYFDTPEHAAFAIQMVTNPRWPDYIRVTYERGSIPNPQPPPDAAAQAYVRIQALLEKHQGLLQSQAGANALAILSMRTALRMGDPPAGLKIAEMIPHNAPIRSEPDFYWILASCQFLSHHYAEAEPPLLGLLASRQASADQKAAAAYGLVGVYRKLGNPVEEIRYALPRSDKPQYADYPSGGNEDMSVYWAYSGWDLDLLLDSEAPIEALRTFAAKYPAATGVRLVKYALAVRLARAHEYNEAAQIYQAINAPSRAARMRRLAVLSQTAGVEARYKLAEFIASNQEKLYFNDSLWQGLQRYALFSGQDSRLTGEERQAALAAERKLKDDQEERWQAYLILRDVVRDAGKTGLGRTAAQLALRCLRGISIDRFGREDDIRKASTEMAEWLRQR